MQKQPRPKRLQRRVPTSFTDAPRDDDLQGCCTAYGDHFQRHVNEAGIAGTVDGLFAQPR